MQQHALKAVVCTKVCFIHTSPPVIPHPSFTLRAALPCMRAVQIGARHSGYRVSDYAGCLTRYVPELSTSAGCMTWALVARMIRCRQCLPYKEQ